MHNWSDAFRLWLAHWLSDPTIIGWISPFLGTILALFSALWLAERSFNTDRQLRREERDRKALADHYDVLWSVRRQLPAMVLAEKSHRRRLALEGSRRHQWFLGWAGPEVSEEQRVRIADSYNETLGKARYLRTINADLESSSYLDSIIELGSGFSELLNAESWNQQLVQEKGEAMLSLAHKMEQDVIDQVGGDSAIVLLHHEDDSATHA